MKEESKPSENKNAARRKILRTLVVGGGAITAARVTPEKWVKPTIESVVLPAHAQTSGGVAGSDGNFISSPVVVQLAPGQEDLIAEEPLSEELLEFFLPSAQAAACANVSCNVEFNLLVDTAAEMILICVDGEVNGTSLVNFISDTEFGSAQTDFGDLLVLGGTFSAGNWNVKVRNVNFNNSTEVTLSPGGVGCAAPS